MSKWSGITKWSGQVFDVELWWDTAGAMCNVEIEVYPLFK